MEPKLLTVAEFPAGWTLDSAPNAASTKNTPTCVADVVLAKGSDHRVDAVFLGPKSEPTAALQTVGSFAPGRGAKSASALRASFASCNGRTLTQAGQSARLTVSPISMPTLGDAGFASKMDIANNGQHAYLDVFFGVKGAYGTSVSWRSGSSSTTLFEQMVAKAMAKL